MSNEKTINFTFNFNAPVGQNIAHVDKIEAHFDKDMNMQVVDTNACMNAPQKRSERRIVEENNSEEKEKEEEPLRNHIFHDRIFDTNERLMTLRNTIASAIDMGEATIMYGKPQEVRINPNAKNEWYYIVKAIEEAGVTKKFAITLFIEQMMEWFPILFPSASQKEWEAFKRRLSKSISEEKGLWKHGKMKEVIPLCDMWAKQKTLGMDAAKMERIYAIAYKGLYQKLMDLKQNIAKAKSR